jgi:hypothetical protein
MSGVNNFLIGVGLGQTQPRDKALNTKVGDRVVDTVEAFDTGDWETGIKNKGKWYIVEKYGDEEEATIGHGAWIKKAPTISLEKLSELNDKNAEEWWG